MLGKLEIRVMEVVWADGDLSVHDVAQRLARPLAYTTVMTTLDRLYKKGLLKRRKIDRAFRYAPALTRTEWEQQRAGEWFSALLTESAPAGDLLISCFVDMLGDQDAALLDALARQIDLKRKRLDGGTE